VLSLLSGQRSRHQQRQRRYSAHSAAAAEAVESSFRALSPPHLPQPAMGCASWSDGGRNEEKKENGFNGE
jgi:hypothetical protein